MACRGVEHSEANHIPDEGRLAAKPTGDLSFGISEIERLLLRGRRKVWYNGVMKLNNQSFHPGRLLGV